MHDEDRLIVVIDDDEAIRRSVARMLVADGFRVLTYPGARAYLERTDGAMPAGALVDLRMPDLDGLALLRAIHESERDTPVVVMTAVGDVPMIVKVMQEGAVDVLAKPFTAAELHAAVARAMDATRARHEERRAIADVWRAAARLTPREAEVGALVACGLLNKQIAAAIGTTEKTVKVHRGRVMHKLGVSSVAELVRLVDGLLSSASRPMLRLDGDDTVRPAVVDVIIETVRNERRRASGAAGRSSFAPAHPGSGTDGPTGNSSPGAARPRM